MGLSDLTKIYLKQDGFSDGDIEGLEESYQQMLDGEGTTLVNRGQDLYERFPGLNIGHSGGACPFQAEGVIFGREFYFRYRHGYARLNVGTGTEGIYGDAEQTAGMSYGDSLAGVLSWDEFESIFGQLADEIAKKIYSN